MKIVSAIYSHPDYYPPTLNAVNFLAKHVTEIKIISRNVKEDEISFPSNVSLEKSGHFKTIRDTEAANYFWKIKSFIGFLLLLYQSIIKYHPEWVLLYDPIPLFAFKILRPFIKKKPKLWYHNHDVMELTRLKKYSISWFAYRAEQKSFYNIDLFTYPSEQRKVYFPLKKLKGISSFLPNYPPKNSHRVSVKKTPKNSLKLIYQGHVGEGHGLLEVIIFLKNINIQLEVSLTIIGQIDETFKQKAVAMIKQLRLDDKVHILPPVPYPKLKEITERHDVGLAIHLPVNLAFNTAATSSNKIYEYISGGLPVILVDNSAYKETLQNREWSFFTDLSEESLEKNLIRISENYKRISEEAINDFKNELNFEHFFQPILPHILLKE